MTVQRILPLARSSRAVVPTEVPLDGQDLAMPRMAMHATWFFLSSAQPRLEQITLQELEEAFSSGMQLFLANFPAAASRTRYDTGTKRWNLEYNDQGADLEVVQLDRPLGNGWKCFDGKADPALAPRPVMIVDDDASVFSVKVTRFSCGSISLSTSTHHWLVDFVGYVDLMEELAKSVSVYVDSPTTLTANPSDASGFDWSRDLLSYAEETEPETIPSETWFAERGAPPQMTRMPSGCRYASLLFTASSLESLKGSLADWALEEPSGGSFERTLPSKANWIGTNDALHALLWAAITDARSVSSDTVTQLHTPLDGRRLLPSLPSIASASRGRYLGNVHPGHVFPLPSSLVSLQDRASLFHLAWLIRTQYLTLTPGQMSSIVRHHNYTSSPNFGPGRMPRCTSMFGNDVVISNISRLSTTQRLDFGKRLGRPYTLTVVGMKPVTLNGLTLDAADGTCFILRAPAPWTSREDAELHQPTAAEGAADGGVIAYVGMRNEDMDKLLALPLIRQFAVVL